ncbi:conserved Plasmodium protein, unknown function [Plasmodium gaboni]|uniref:Tetratricopeptide repeat protein n=1 Tax=Plasmodium gaboni TaxID=647221 RepID=A0ABY1UR96_9APIC|nr:conserved Plasmodium protein, unknown function [Plasmodium gaboni]
MLYFILAYNIDSDDEAPCEYLNDIYAISEDTFCFKIIKQLGNGYYSPGNGHKIKIIYYELGCEENITSANVYLGKNDKLPYICEIAAKCMKENEVCLIQGPKNFSKVFKNSEIKNKYDKTHNFKAEFKKGLRYKQKCVDKYSRDPAINKYQKIKINSNDINLLIRKKKIKKDKNEKYIDQVNIKSNLIKNMNDLKNNCDIKIVNYDNAQTNNCNNNSSNDKLCCQNETSLFLNIEDINNLKYKFLEQTELCTYVIYLKEFRRVDILNDDKTIIKEIINEGKGICTPKKNDYIDFFINENNKQEYIHTILDINNLKYRGLFQILQHMKKKEMSKIILKGNQCDHINHTNHINEEHNYLYNTIQIQHKLINIKKNTSHEHDQIINDLQYCDENRQSINNIQMNNIQMNNIQMNHINNSKNSCLDNDTNNLDTNIIEKKKKKKKELYIQLIDYKKSKIVNINSIININTSEKLLLYINDEKNIYKTNNINKNIQTHQPFNIPTIDNECELIIKMTLTHLDNTTKENIYLPICYTKNNKNIKQNKAYFIYSYGSCFTSPLWFFHSLQNLKEGQQIIIPIAKNKNMFQQNQFLYHIIYENVGITNTVENNQKDNYNNNNNNNNNNSSNNNNNNNNNANYQINTQEKQCAHTKKNMFTLNSAHEKNIKTINNTYKQNNKHKNNFIESLISNRNQGKGFYLIKKFKKSHVNKFCNNFFKLHQHYMEKNKHEKKIKSIKNIKKLLNVHNKINYYHNLFMHFKFKHFHRKIIKRKKKNIPISTKNIINNKLLQIYMTQQKEDKKKKKKKKKDKNHNKTNDPYKEQYKKIYNSTKRFEKKLKNVYFDRFFYNKDTILKIKVIKIICKKKDPWNMNISEQIENIKIYNDMGNKFTQAKLYYAASIQYKKAFDICRFSKIYNLIFEEKKKLQHILNDYQNKKHTEQTQEQNYQTQLLSYIEKIITNLSITFYKINNYNECIIYAEKAFIINPQNVKAIYWKNMSYIAQNKYTQVIQNLNNPFCLNNQTLLKLYNSARLIKKKHDTNFNSLFYAMYDNKKI